MKNKQQYSFKGRVVGKVATLSVFIVAGLLAAEMPAMAVPNLDNVQLSGLQFTLSAALKGAGNNPTAIESVISQQLQSAIATYGADKAGALTSAFVAIAEQDGVASNVIGIALAQAASATEASCKASYRKTDTCQIAASGVAAAIANGGNQTEIASFESTADSLGYTNLASLAGGTPEVTGSIGGNTGGNLSNAFNGNLGGGPGGSAGCAGPSCTNL